MVKHKLIFTDVVDREFEIEAESEDTAVEILRRWSDDVGLLDEKCVTEHGRSLIFGDNVRVLCEVDRY